MTPTRPEATDVEQVCHDGTVLAIIVRDGHRTEGVRFFTPDSYSQQLACMCHPAGTSIQPHRHRPIERSVINTQEVLVIKKGSLRVDFYSEDNRAIDHRTLYAGDVILLASGAHGFEVLDDLEMIEVKQGPYAGDADKVRFEGCKAPTSNAEER